MPSDQVKLEIEGLKELQKKAMQMLVDMAAGSPILQRTMAQGMLILTRRAMQTPGGGRGTGTPVGYVPVDTGRLRASITPTVSAHGNIVQGIVGTNVAYAPYIEMGTRPHWPPRAALETWARRHHTDAFLVCRAIATKGTKAYKFFQTTIAEKGPTVQRLFDKAVKLIVSKRP